MTTSEELQKAYESLEQIDKAWKAGDYDHNFFLYERDQRNTEATIERLKKKLEKEI